VSSYWRFFLHLIWATKGREPLIGDREKQIIRWSMRTTLDELQVLLHAVGMMPDHVHLVVSVPPKVAVADVVRRLKGASSHAANHVDTRRSSGVFAWQTEYGGLPFGERSLPRVVAYVERQREHHAANDLWPTLERTAEEP
jgi:putative transposase